jgi:hypothetical protein
MPTYAVILIALQFITPALFLLFGYRAGVRVGTHRGYSNGRTAASLALTTTYGQKIVRSSTYGKKVNP